MTLHVLLPGTIFAAVIATLWVSDFIESDPRFCGQCHVTRRDHALWTRDVHKNIVCQRCHHQEDGEKLRMLALFVFEGRAGDEGLKKRQHAAAVGLDACAQCHLSHDPRWTQIGGSVGHETHMRAKDVSCLDCHGGSGHQLTEAVDSCVDCHEPRSLQTSGMEALHCLACHNFLTKDDETFKPTREACLECHLSQQLNPTFPANAPMATFPCWACHRPHQQELPSEVDCAECHEDISDVGLHKNAFHEVCPDCHTAHTWISKNRQCTGCHRELVSHYAHQPCRRCHSFIDDTPPRRPTGDREPE